MRERERVRSTKCCKSHATLPEMNENAKKNTSQLECEKGQEKKWMQNVRRKQYFARATIFRVNRAHNENVMNFLISISTIYLSIFFMSLLSFRRTVACLVSTTNKRIYRRPYFRMLFACYQSLL